MSSDTPKAGDERAALARVPTKLYIGGEWREASAGGTLTVEDPATQEPLAEVADAQVEDALAALAAAADKQAEWAATAPRERGRSCAAPTRRSSSGPRSWRC